MKRFRFLLLAFLTCMFLASCAPHADGGSNTNGTKVTVLDLEAEANAITETYSLTSGKRYTSLSKTAGEYLDEDLIRSYYGDAAEMPDFGSVEAYAVYIDESRPTLPCEFGIFKMKDGADTKRFMAFLQARIDLKIENARSYPSTDTEPLTTARVSEKNGYIWYCAVKGGNEAIDQAFRNKLSN